MTSEELRQAMVVAGLSCKVERQEVTLQVCTFCGNEKYNLGLNPEKGLYYAWCCKNGGRLDSLLRQLTGQTHHIPVQRGEKKAAPVPQQVSAFKTLPIDQVPSAANYLARRGITPVVANEYGLVVCVEPKHRLDGRICVPAKDYWTGEVLGWNGRSYTGKMPKYLSTLQQKAVTGFRHRDQRLPAVVVEGPMDGIAAHRAGFQVAVLGGIATAGLIEWAARLQPGIPVAIMLDGSALIQAQQLYWEITPVRPTGVAIVRLDEEEDPASLGVEGVRIAIREALSAGGSA